MQVNRPATTQYMLTNILRSCIPFVVLLFRKIMSTFKEKKKIDPVDHQKARKEIDWLICAAKEYSTF